MGDPSQEAGCLDSPGVEENLKNKGFQQYLRRFFIAVVCFFFFSCLEDLEGLLS